MGPHRKWVGLSQRALGPLGRRGEGASRKGLGASECSLGGRKQLQKQNGVKLRWPRPP